MWPHVGPSSAQLEQAWHFLTVLIRLGRPARPAELPSPDLAALLCGIPGSPLILTSDGLVAASSAALAALGVFAVRSMTLAPPRVTVRALPQRRACRDVSLVYSRKRKAGDLEDQPPEAKRRLLPPPERALEALAQGDCVNQLAMEIGTKSVSCQADSNFFDLPMKGHFSIGMSTMEYKPSILNQASVLPPYLLNFHKVLSSISLNKINLLGEDDQTEVSKKTDAIIVHDELMELESYKHVCLDVNINAKSFKEITTENFEVAEPDGRPTTSYENIDMFVLDQETCAELSVPYVGMQLLTQHDINSTVPNFARAEEEWSVPLNEDTALTSPTENPKEKERTFPVVSLEREENTLDANAIGRELEKPMLIVTDQTDFKLKPHAGTLSFDPTAVWKQQRKSFAKPRNMDRFAEALGLKSSNGAKDDKKVKNFTKEAKIKRERCTSLMQKLRKGRNRNSLIEDKEDAIPKALSTMEPKLLPDFESFIIEEEEGSGGYGTVYRARRKKDGKVFAVKCPHANAHLHHIRNELKMLQRFGGRNFVIKYEGSFKSGEFECFLLEHVEHDRPEVLKKEINVFELQWYGYCMFRALSSLHKQGIVHRDVKPGNFLFSRKLNKGYLIDFNLANDLHRRICSSRSSMHSDVNLDPVSLPSTQSRKLTKNEEIQEAIDDLKRPVISKGMNKRHNVDGTDIYSKTDRKNKYKSQPADGSGVTSTKEQTSTRTSGDRLKEPMPCKGRKEFINYVHEAMQSPNNQMVTAPASQRKRVAAPMAKVDRRHLIITPMPLHSVGSAVAGAVISNMRGNGRQKREGPCVGTKGFRAPEVLFKSYHQGCKVDVWSAGVTLLYLMIGRTPFGGDPPQNVKDIAKLRGSEDVWEVAKLHNCESSFPMDLLDVQSLQSMQLKDWCALNTRRPEFLELVPDSLFDLVDKCLTVNPRLRFTAEEALMHDFFKPCHESLRKQRLLRRTEHAPQS